MMREAKGWIFENNFFFWYKNVEPVIKKLRAKKWQQKRKTGDNEVEKYCENEDYIWNWFLRGSKYGI
jgi:hypothetical protein